MEVQSPSARYSIGKVGHLVHLTLQCREENTADEARFTRTRMPDGSQHVERQSEVNVLEVCSCGIRAAGYAYSTGDAKWAPRNALLVVRYFNEKKPLLNQRLIVVASPLMVPAQGPHTISPP